MEMTATKQVSFGYNTPSGERGIERIDSATFVRDLEVVCDLASQHFDTFWVPDHFMRGDTFRLECWTQLTWLAARYPAQLLGTIVMANSYRHPPLLAKMAATLQEFSRGRLILGYGAGWLQDEYEAYGYPFPSTRVRIAEMVEGIQAIRTLWTRTPATFDGSYLHVRDAYCHPQPDPIPPIMIGGDGERYLLRAVAEHGDWWLPFSHDLATLRHKIAVLHQHCKDVGRDPDLIVKVYPLTVYLASSKSAAEQHADAALPRDESAFAGEPEALREHLMELVDLGFSHFALAFGGFPGVDDIRLFADRVMPAFNLKAPR
jgi:alkanesulfonate monooxygenase SsuD/methylene tetrahydromethanopterin reductase-like flavin-dependent oxidoreductase (luciferase family)